MVRRFIAAARRNERLGRNIVGTIVVRGISLLLGLATMPAYLRFLPEASVLGVWFTVLSVFTWLTYLDFGVGNGLRTRVVEPLSKDDGGMVNRLVSSSYVVSTVIAISLFFVGALVVSNVGWNRVFGVPENLVPPDLFCRVLLILLAGIAVQVVLKNTLGLFYALEWNVAANSLSGLSAVGLLMFLLSAQTGVLSVDLQNLACAHAVANAVPLMLATVWVFRSGRVGGWPRLRSVDAASMREVSGVGVMFLVVQLGLVVISSTDQILIATLFVPAYVVEYQAYLKIFGMVSMVFSLLTQPLWSAVAVARARGDVAWIARASRALLRVAALCSLGCVAVVGALPWIFDIWLGPGAIAVSYMTAAVFAMLATADVFLLAVTCIANGLGELRTQVAFTVLGAIVKVPLTLLFIELFGHWVFVVLAHALAIAPLVVVQGVVLRRRLSIRALRASSTAVE